MSDPLATYLHDHLAGSNFAIDLLRSMRDHYPNESLGQLASTVLLEVEEDRETLRRIVERVGKGSPDLKEAAAWILEKTSRLKLGHGEAKGIGTFQALETLALGILGKLALWRALAILAEKDDRLRDLDFRELIARAEAQHAKIEENRLLVARTALARISHK
jgi:hypothetical protein